MILLDINNLKYNKEELLETKKLRNRVYNLFLNNKINQYEIFKKFINKYNNLENSMLTKSAQQEATTKIEAKEYHKNLQIGFNYLIDKINKECCSKINHYDIINLNRLVEPKSHKKHPNSYRHSEIIIGKHAPPKPSKIYNLMENLLINLNETEINPIIKAAYAHHEFVRIHPFSDGNGRVARLVGNWILINGLYVPTYIKSNEKKEYNKSLALSFKELEKSNKITEKTENFFNSVIQREKRSLLEILNEI